MALFRLSRASRRLQSSIPSISFTQSIILFHNPTDSPNPHPNHNPGTSSRHHWTKFVDNYVTKHEFTGEKFKFRGFESIKLGHMSTLAGENKEEEDRKNVSSASSSSWIDMYLPKKARPYAHLARLDKPIGTWLLAWPCMW